MPTDIQLSRRLLMGMMLSLPWSAKAASPGGIVSLDYGLASTLLSLGVTPAAIASLPDWRRWVVEPPLPDGVVDLGTTGEINMEVLSRLKPSLILSNPFLGALRPRLETIAPVREFTVYAPDRDALPAAMTATRDLGDLLGRQGQAEAFLSEADHRFADCRGRLDRLSPPPVALIQFMDERHARVFAGRGLYQGALDRLGLINAWQKDTSYWGFQTIALEELVSLPSETHLMVFEPLIPADILLRLEDNPLWLGLPFVREKRVSVLPGVLMFGMVREAMRFAELITQSLEQHTR